MMRLLTMMTCCGIMELTFDGGAVPQTEEQFQGFQNHFFDSLVRYCYVHKILYTCTRGEGYDAGKSDYNAFFVSKLLENGWVLLDEFKRNLNYADDGVILLLSYDTTPLMPILEDKRKDLKKNDDLL